MIRYEIRGVGPSDEEQILELAAFLNTVNLPNDRGHIQRLLEHAEKSFSGAIKSPPHCKYVFVLWDLEANKAVGTSMIVAQLGRRDAPYIYLDVTSEEKYSKLLDKHFHHTVLRVGYSYKGPTEIGGLVVHPAERAGKQRLGLQISYVRFLYIAAHRELFQDEILAELLPPLEPDGKSHLWEALGRRFTDMSYAEADLLSSENKEFVRDLFPRGDIYASVLSPEAQDVIGKVGTQTKGVEKMLRRIGFRYAERVDPFDGGPHFVAQADEITLVSETKKVRLAGPLSGTDSGVLALVGRDYSEPPWFRAVYVPAALEPKGAVRIPAEAIERLSVGEGDDLWVLPIR
jgi:arginine N-succinyltransferase